MSRALSPAAASPMAWPASAGSGGWRAPPSTGIATRSPTGRAAGPVGPMPDAALVAAIRAVLAASPFHGEGHRKVWARLRVEGIRTSKRRVLRLMREHDLLAPSRIGAPRGPRNHDGTIIPETIDTMWGTDLTTALDGRRASCRVRGRRSLQCRVRRPPCQAPGHPL